MKKNIIFIFVTIILIPIILHLFGWDDFKTSILCTVLVALIEQVIILCNKWNKLNKEFSNFSNTLQIRLDDLFHVLQNKEYTTDTILLLADSILKLSLDKYNDNDIFVNFYIDRLKVLSDKINKSCNTGKFEIDYNMDKEDYSQLSKSIFKVFNKKQNDYFFTISKCDKDSIDWFFNINKMSNTYLKMSYSFLKDGKISEVNRLFLFKELNELNYDLINLLFLLHYNSGFNIRLLKYNSFLAQFNKEHLYADFGIYGEHFVFENNSDYTNGEPIFCGFNIKSERIIEYTKCFKNVWDIAYKIEFDKQITHVIESDDTIIIPMRTFKRNIHELKFDEIDKIQSIICEEYNIS